MKYAPFYKQLLKIYIQNYYLLLPISIILISCLGAFGTLLLSMEGMSLINVLHLLLVVVLAMIYLVGVIGQLPRKQSFFFLYWGVIAELILVIYHFFTFSG
ncbi:MAG: hypothetical protein OXC92_04275 [Flavobacteriaceae bacterium]|nr:hypothetical protein [Flavobacteriaceae bacterium]MCY4216185.1 hypothetical protein [Flavobacteriaceae bacterium]MCY4254270.1 hypothetical protein [Flavobacteriaceae bacterium]